MLRVQFHDKRMVDRGKHEHAASIASYGATRQLGITLNPTLIPRALVDQLYIMGGAAPNSARTIEAYSVLRGGVILKPDLALDANYFAAVVINP